MIKVFILDLDDTLIDTSAVESLRSSGNWREIPKLFNQCFVYKDILGLVNTAHSIGIKIAIFTNSPSTYVESLLKHFNIYVDFVIAYHDVQNHKPHKEGVEKILNHFDVTSDQVVYLGDNDLDKQAATNANVDFFAVEWGNVSNVGQEHMGIYKLSELIGTRTNKPQNKQIRSELQRSANVLYLGYYSEGIKQEIWAFKDDVDEAIKRWSNKAVELAENFPNVDVVVRALGHSELEVLDNAKPLDRLALGLADALGAVYRPSLVKKSRKLEKSTKLSAVDRKLQIRGVYSAHVEKLPKPKLESLTFLIVDDVYTSGATTSDISRAISEAYPEANVYIFALVKTLYRAQVETASKETQINTQLFADLYHSLSINSASTPNDKPERAKGKLVNIKYSANYAKTNHNFIFQNLKQYSIASESNSITEYNVIQILKNILQRGKPTIASKRLRKSFGVSVKDSGNDTSALALISNKPVEWSRLIRGKKESLYFPAKYFFDELIPKYLGDYKFVKQLMVPEVRIFDMTQVYVDQFHNRQVDFFIPQVGLIIEIDGSQHRQSKDVDEKRDAFTETLGLKTIRFTVQEVESENDEFVKKIREVLSHIELVDNLEQEGSFNPPNGITIQNYKTAFTEGIDPSDSRVRLTASIRFQILLLELLERGVIKLGGTRKISLVNRDKIEFSIEALKDLNELIGNLYRLQGGSKGFLDLQIEELEEIPDNRLGVDIIIDFSIFERYGDEFQTNQDVIYSRTDYFDFYRHFSSLDAVSIESSALIDYDFFQISCTGPVVYDLDLNYGSPQYESLKYFLSNLFLPFLDGVDFREGQAGIIGSALSRNGTIGLLPTGSGKSICYQLSAILQPAVSFVVCPIKSLMYDQKIDLDAIGFTRTNYITGDLSAQEKAKIQRDFGRGCYFFVYISPERFQTNGFRKEMLAIGLNLSFSYAVIDEAHCLSEWGHDFRTSYLNLANTINRFSPGATYIGLTATASVNVLKDIQTEFNVSDQYIRTPLNFTREELAFHVIDDNGDKSNEVARLVNNMDEKWNADKDRSCNAGIIFTLNVNGDNGCYSLAARLAALLDMDVRFFSGSIPKYSNYYGKTFDDYKRKVQEDFKSNKYRLLTATKAFGMGVNKGNIAYTIHYGIPSSMEALYQEAGRAGRDKSLFVDVPADCYVLLTKEPNNKILDKIWDPITSVSELKKNIKLLNRNSDINSNLYLMTVGLDTIKDEFVLINNIYSYLQSNNKLHKIILIAGDFKTSKPKLERAIYRLSQLGIVSDWTIEDFFKGKLQIEFKCLSVEQLEANIEQTIRKYEPKFKFSEICSSEYHYYKIICNNLKKGAYTNTSFVFLVLLLWSYDHFVYNRRQSLKTVYEQCILLASGDIQESEFKNRLESYFTFNESSHTLLQLVENPTNTKLWLSVFFKESEATDSQNIINSSELSTLKEQISRFLESYKSNICLDYLSGIVRLTEDQFDNADGERRMSASLDHIIAKDKDSALELVKQTLQLKSILSIDSRSRFSRLIHEKFNDTDILRWVNKEFRDPYSYRKLIEPPVSRLDIIINKYKDINW
ncbi:RecQ family ATP-dependent DNA helicase [Candidatus Woesearchaeota archaeon]|nr:RecQ family ATP-dependent DNA helicase [Candidatus Woesearchaeota archaeon]MBT7558176.1 RecQ family ATP-dependent DNA helicase [Candidatus Woesearchaeota archaeon]